MTSIPVSIDRARYWALTTPAVAFYGSLASNLADVIDDSIDTASTNGSVIKWSPKFVEGLTDAEVRFVLLHETLHCAHDHFHRLPLNDQGNEAGDYAINAVLAKVAGISMPKGGLLDAKFDGMAEEEILAALAKRPQPPQPQPGQGQPQPGQGQPQPGQGQPQQGNGPCGGFEAPAPAPAVKPGQTPPPDMQEKWKRALVAADMAAKSLGRGNVPADLQRLIDSLTAPTRVDWRQETADFVRSSVATRNDWTRSARRMATAPVIYPRRKVNDTGRVLFVRDTSGSIDDKLVGEFTALIAQCTADLGCSSIVMDCDAEIHGEHWLEAGEEAPTKAQGGGGTDFRPPFARAAELIESGESIAGIVYLTDLEGPEPDETDVPTLWLSTTTKVAQTGRTVAIH
jgi:predicted metal-dependent peptidase